jgi:hypothetical protein
MKTFFIHCKPPLRGLSAIQMECLPFAESDVANETPPTLESRADRYKEELTCEYEDVISAK